MYWSDQFDAYMPEAVRITGHPKGPELPLDTHEMRVQTRHEWKEIEAYEDAGLIYIDWAARNAVEHNRRCSQRQRGKL
jgi:hypothetical protein